MKSSLIKNNLKSISKTRRRFISILIMAFLGVGFYSGLVATSPDMVDSLDKYLDKSKLYDINVVSTLGLTDDDLNAIKNIEGISAAYGIQSKDSIVDFNEKENVCKIIEYNENINVPTLSEGRLPENSNECLLDSKYSIEGNAEGNIGKIISIQNDDKNSDGSQVFEQKELKVVGIVESPLYISSQRGNTSIGNGNISFYIYVKDDVINLDYYTEICLQVKGAEEKVTNSDEYLELVNPVIQKAENIKEERENARYDELVNNAISRLSNLKMEYNGKDKEIEGKFSDGQNEIKNIEKCKWYIQDRLDNSGYTNIFDATKTMSNISKIFPIIFYIVAILISLTSMTRMIEEERIEIGTLKSLGYNNFQIVSKYVIYSFLASVIGGIIGMSVGFYLLPNIVWILYSIIYTMPEFYATYRLSIGIIGTVIAFACIGGATIIVAFKELKEMPSVLMRPKPPKNGKRILLENIKFIWKKLNFSKKVTIRNIFRYKKRAIMTIVGIAGCTGLMVTGFGIKDSVVDIPNAQYGGIFKYEYSISLSNTDGLNDLEEYLKSYEKVEDYCKINATTGKLKNNDLDYNVTIFIPNENNEFNNVCNMIDRTTGEKITLNDNGIVITDKIADMLGVNEGDEITLIDSDNSEFKLKIEAITKNHVSHYVYMSKNFFEKNIKLYKTNMIFLNTKEFSNDETNEFQEKILSYKGVTTVTSINTLMSMIDNMLSTMNYVVVILIIASALLAFVVLYNLANINIGERIREIATLKVLGFYDKEVDNYINKENIIFTFIGVAIGLVFGTFLTNVIIASIEIDNLRFMINIRPISYLYSAIITISFSIIVNWIIHFALKKIDMIESLKSIE